MPTHKIIPIEPKQDFIIKKSTSKLTVCIIGDVGTRSKIQKKVAKSLAKRNSDQVRGLGDLVYYTGITALDS